VPAHNEESQIGAKIRNLLASDYPRHLVEILIGNDGSSDHTKDIAREFAPEGVHLVSSSKRIGKSAIQNLLAAAASGEMLVFTDADCLYDPGAFSRLVENFADPRVGLVTGHPRYANENGTAITANEGVYLRYETWLRRQESERGILAMASGSLFAMRRSLWEPLGPRLGDDFVLPLRVARAGMVSVLDDRVSPVTRLTADRPASMLRMKARIISKDLHGLLAHAALLNPLRYGSLGLALWSHKLLRWLVPYFLVALLGTNLFWLHAPVFRAFLALQVAFYGLALLALALGGRKERLPFSPLASFCLVNFAALLGTVRTFRGKTQSKWTPERNPDGHIQINPTAELNELK